MGPAADLTFPGVTEGRILHDCTAGVMEAKEVECNSFNLTRSQLQRSRLNWEVVAELSMKEPLGENFRLKAFFHLLSAVFRACGLTFTSSGRRKPW